LLTYSSTSIPVDKNPLLHFTLLSISYLIGFPFESTSTLPNIITKPYAKVSDIMVEPANDPNPIYRVICDSDVCLLTPEKRTIIPSGIPLSNGTKIDPKKLA